MAKVKYSHAALRDLEQIGDYIADNLKNLSAAQNTLDMIQGKIAKLADFPKIGVHLSAYYEDVGGYRYLVCGNYLAFYREVMENVHIDRILYGKRDYISILFGTLQEDDSE